MEGEAETKEKVGGRGERKEIWTWWKREEGLERERDEVGIEIEEGFFAIALWC